MSLDTIVIPTVNGTELVDIMETEITTSPRIAKG